MRCIDQDLEKNVGMLIIVVSAINFTEGGQVTMLRECLVSAAAVLTDKWEIVAFVNRVDLINETRIRLMPIPSSKKSWFHRLYWQWFGFGRVSRELKPSLWLSLHNITPRVSAAKRFIITIIRPFIAAGCVKR